MPHWDLHLPALPQHQDFDASLLDCKSLDSSGGVDAVMPGSADVHDAVEQNVKTLIPSKSSQSGSICAFSYKMCLHF